MAFDLQRQDAQAWHEDHEIGFAFYLAYVLGDVEGVQYRPPLTSGRLAQGIEDKRLTRIRAGRVIRRDQVSHSSPTSIWTISRSSAQYTVDGEKASILNAVTDPPLTKANTWHPESSTSVSSAVSAGSLRRRPMDLPTFAEVSALVTRREQFVHSADDTARSGHL